MYSRFECGIDTFKREQLIYYLSQILDSDFLQPKRWRRDCQSFKFEVII